ncbi:MAG: hypothetical protein IKO30_03200 [Lachnospiraceae bacterium]|nr:hypothetical protein [Lachnospiraceae bacterium]
MDDNNMATTMNEENTRVEGAALTKKEQKIAKRRTKYEKALSQDIKYRGPLSYRGFRVIAWAAIICIPIALLYMAAAKFKPSLEGRALFFEFLRDKGSDIVLPMFMIANFTAILDERDSYKNIIKRFAILTIACTLGAIFAYLHYFTGLSKGIAAMLEVEESMLSEMVYTAGVEGYLVCNLFIDLLLCTLFMFFVNYIPQKHFRGKNIKYFRMLCLLPLLYEAVFLSLKILAFEGRVTVPLITYALMPSKPPVMILFFIMMVLGMKRREKRFLEAGLSREQYKAYLKTNTNSLHFSTRACVYIIACSIIDILVSLVIAVIIVVNMSAGDVEAINDDLITYCADTLRRWGFFSFDKLFAMILPMLLFSYTRTHKNKKIDTFLPIAAIGIMIIVVIEGGYHVLKVMIEAGVDLVK